MKLVIAEKPSVGAAIAAVIGANEKRSGYFEGSGYLVSWCIGHLISLADAATYNEQYRKWKYDDLPIVPQDWQFTVASGKEQQFQRPYAAQRRFRDCQCVRQRARGRTHFSICLRTGKLPKALFPPLD